MNKFLFWRSWHPAYKFFLYGAFILFFISIGFFCFSIIKGEEQVIKWEVETEASRKEVEIDNFEKGIFKLPITTDNYLLTQQFIGSALFVNTTAAHVYLSLVTLSLLILLTIISTLKRFWYLGSMILFVAFLVNLKTELLFFPSGNAHLFLAFLLFFYLGTSFYFQAFASSASLLTRFLSFFGISVAVAILIKMNATVSNPFLSLATYSLPFTLILSFAFIILVAPEVIRGLLYITTFHGNGEGKGAEKHFILISGIYLFSLLLVYWKNTQVIFWDIVYLNEFLLLLFSSVLGFWGLKQKEKLWQKILPFYPLGALFYAALGVICFTTVGLCFAMANDPLIEFFEDLIVYAHLALGAMFLIYVLVNFHPLLQRNFSVIKVVFAPQRMPFSLAFIVGILVMGILFLRADFLPLYQAKAGYNNVLGDLNLEGNNSALAEQYYKTGRAYQKDNHRSNYSLASLSLKNEDLTTALFYFKEAASKQASAYDFVNIASIYNNSGLFFEAFFSLKEGLDKFPENGPIRNNLALLYRQTNVLDSALYYLSSAEESKVQTNTNELAIFAESTVALKTDTLKTIFEQSTHLPFKSNLSLLATQQSSLLPNLPLHFMQEETRLNLYSFTYLYNYGINQWGNKDADLDSLILKASQLPSNIEYAEELKRLRVLRAYKQNRVGEAFQILKPLADQFSDRQVYYNNLMGTLALDQGANGLASNYFKRISNTSEQAKLNYAIALTEGGKREEALAVWGMLKDIEGMEAAELMIKVLNYGGIEITDLNDALKYETARIWLAQEDWGKVNNILEFVVSEKYQTDIILYGFEVALKKRNLSRMQEFYEKLEEIEELSVKQERKKTELLLIYFIQNKSYDELAKVFHALPKFREGDESSYEQMRLLSQAILAQQLGDDKLASNIYSSLAYANPFFELGIEASADFFRTQKKDDEQAYHILLDALEVNLYSVSLNKAYILQCFRMGLDNFAEQALYELSQFASVGELEGFRDQYEKIGTEGNDLFW